MGNTHDIMGEVPVKISVSVSVYLFAGKKHKYRHSEYYKIVE